MKSTHANSVLNTSILRAEKTSWHLVHSECTMGVGIWGNLPNQNEYSVKTGRICRVFFFIFLFNHTHHGSCSSKIQSDQFRPSSHSLQTGQLWLRSQSIDAYTEVKYHILSLRLEIRWLLPGFSCRTGYGCKRSWFTHSTSPRRARFSSRALVE